MAPTLSVVHSSTRRGRDRPALYVGLSGDAPFTPPMRISLFDVDQVAIGRGERGIVRKRVDGATQVTVTLEDPRLSGKHAMLSYLGGAWVIRDLESKNGTWIATERITQRTLADEDVVQLGHTAIVFREQGGEAGDLVGPLAAVDPGLRTLSVAAERQFADLAAAARSQVVIELGGESGTGKELAARAVHVLSGRRGRFVAVNCGALPGTLLEAELFGHKKGAYTGATDDRLGFVRSADGGTLFLDEVAELPAASQAALLRVLQESEVMPIGGDRPVKVDLRIVVASLKSLDDEVLAKRFREDLRARMLGVRVVIPPLRERREDLGWLVAALLERAHPGRSITFSSDAVAALYAYDWPLNIRELERALTAAVALAGDRIELSHLPEALRSLEPAGPTPAPAPESDAERALYETLVAAVARHGGNLSAVARELGKDRKQIQRWVKRFGITRT